ncbi:hypothetical protein LINPERPRIM_LOCUS25358, partial [Linum perenne]
LGLRTNPRHCRLQAPFWRHFLVLNNRRQNPFPLAVSKLTVRVPGFNLGGPSFRMTNATKKRGELKKKSQSRTMIF